MCIDLSYVWTAHKSKTKQIIRKIKRNMKENIIAYRDITSYNPASFDNTLKLSLRL